MWIFVQRLSIFLATVIAGDQIVSRLLDGGAIHPDKVYSAADVAGILNIEEAVVRQLIKKGDLKARKVEKNYMILGKNIKDFLNE